MITYDDGGLSVLKHNRRTSSTPPSRNAPSTSARMTLPSVIAYTFGRSRQLPLYSMIDAERIIQKIVGSKIFSPF